MESLESDYVFVYSSLREGFRRGEYNYISSYFSFVSKAKVKGILSDLGYNPVATPTTENYFIKGELYRINNRDEFSYAIGQLDDYEGVKPEADEKALYKREIATIYKDDGNEIPAWIYWYRGNVKGKPLIESGDVMEYINSKNDGY
ncbi:MAG TPA: gamma-glutamylcyclotransferase family protein [Hanamia sp.]